MTFACRSCGSESTTLVLDLGAMPLANSLVDGSVAPTAERRFPLDLVICDACKLLQITESVDPSLLFTNYVYFSSFSDTMLDHAGTLARETVAQRRLSEKHLVVEAASNDGYLLKHYKGAGVNVLGIEPATNVAAVAEAQYGIPTLRRFFGKELADELVREGKRADVFHAHNVLAHVPDINGFVAGIATLLSSDGIAIIEVPYAREMLERTEFDTIYHEHLFYFSLNALVTLFGRHGLTVQDVRRLSIHGGSLRIVAGRGTGASPAVEELLEDEHRVGMLANEYYVNFADDVRRTCDNLRAILTDLRRAGRRIAGYGAAAKATTLLNFAQIGSDVIEMVFDRSTYKQGRQMPGVHIPIRAPSELMDVRPDYLVVLAWNFADEIIRQQDAFRRSGGRFVIPIPSVKIV